MFTNIKRIQVIKRLQEILRNLKKEIDNKYQFDINLKRSNKLRDTFQKTLIRSLYHKMTILRELIKNNKRFFMIFEIFETLMNAFCSKINLL